MNDSTFQREDRYIVIKRSDLEKVPVGYWSSLIEPIGALQAHLPHRECLVIESDWPEYDQAWRMIERRMAGQLPVTAAEELEAVLHWRDKHAVAIKERDALQDRLNAADQRIDDFAGGECEWHREDDSGIWNSGCGETWSFHEDGPEENGMHFCHSCGKRLVVEVAEQEQDDDWHMNPCKQGHRDVGASGGVAACNQCDEKIEAATTQEAFERWNATHPATESAESR